MDPLVIPGQWERAWDGAGASRTLQAEEEAGRIAERSCLQKAQVRGRRGQGGAERGQEGGPGAAGASKFLLMASALTSSPEGQSCAEVCAQRALGIW